MLEELKDWKNFERMVADLLSAEGLEIKSEPYVDRTGTDLVAEEEFRSHSGRSVRVRWRVQCKHYAGSGSNLARREAVEMLTLFDATAQPDEGLFVVISTDYTEEAFRVFDAYSKKHPNARISLWNRRQLVSKLERHPDILHRYGLRTSGRSAPKLFEGLTLEKPPRVLLLSDQSAFAHDVTNAFRQIGADLTFLPFWNYLDGKRLALIQSGDAGGYDLVVCFLGDSFGLPIPAAVIERVLALHKAGSAVLLFPFVAWSMGRHGLYPAWREISPVELIDPTNMEDSISPDRVWGEYRRGDFRWLLRFDSFAEDQYMEIDPTTAAIDAAFSRDLMKRFGIAHSYEYLRPHADAKVAVTDVTGNPVVATRQTSWGRVCYLNSCCHSCMTPVPISSPLAASSEFAVLFRNIIGWLLKADPKTPSSVR